MHEGALPVVPYLKIPETGEPYLEGSACDACGAVLLGQRVVCPKCTARSGIKPRRLSSQGVLYTYSIVHRSYPGIAVPFVSAIVDLDGGGTVKGNLVGVAPDPEKIPLGMPVDVVFGDALGRRDKDGRGYLSFFFRPREAPR